MINFKDYILNNSVKAGRKLFVPKKYIASLCIRHTGEKAGSIFQLYLNLFDTNNSYRKEFDTFISETFNLGESKRIESLKDDKYKGINLNHDYPFSNSVNNGLSIIKEILEIDDIRQLDKDDMFKLMDIRLSRVEEICRRNSVINCGIEQNLFDFVIVRECLLSGNVMDEKEVSQEFFNLLYYSEVLDSLVDNVKDPQRVKCLDLIKQLSLLSEYDPRFVLVSLEELKHINFSELFYYVGTNVNVLINVLNYYSEDPDKVLPQLFINFLNNVGETIEDVLCRRETETLESIGASYNVTRERVRQLEEKGISLFNEFYLDNFTSESKNFIFIFPKVVDVFPISTYKDILKDKNDAFRIVFKSLKYAGTAKYYEDFDAVIENEIAYKLYKTNIDEVLGHYFKQIDLDSKITECLDSLESRGVNRETITNYINFYYEKQKSIYVKKKNRINKAFILEKIMFDHFDQGFHFSNFDQVDEFNKYAIEEFGEPLFPNPNDSHLIQALLLRSGVRLIDRGTYIHESKANNLTLELINHISKYLEDKNSAVAYADIFETFKDELIATGITNRFALQGAMSVYEGQLFKGKRDYVSPISIQQTLRERISSWILNQASFFTYEDFKKEFKGVAQSVFASGIYSVKGIIYYWDKGYININNLNISQLDKDKIEQLLNILISNYHMEYCSADEIFELVNVQMKSFITDCKITYSYDLFSVIQALFDDEYKFKRPLIGSKDAVFESRYEILDGYLASRNVVKLNKLRQFLDSKCNGNTYYPIFDIIKDKWNEFVAIDIDTIVRKNTINITEREIVKLDVVVEMLLEQQKEVNVKEDIVDKHFFKEIANMQINEYLIAGLVNTYLHDKFSVLLDGKNYRGGTFLISNKINSKD